MPADTAAEQARPIRRNRGQSTGAGALVAIAGVLAGVVAGVLTVLGGADAYAALGLPDPGSFTRFGLPLARTAAQCGAAVCVGSLLLAAFGVPARSSGLLAADGYAAVRWASWAGLTWFAGALLTVPLSAADASGVAVTDLFDPSALFGTLDAVEEAKAWLLTAGIALIVAVSCRLVLTWNWSTGLFFLALAGLFPIVATGHSGSGGAHDLTTNSLLYHLFGAVLWVGGLVALLAHAARRGTYLDLVARRFSGLALVCWITMAASGVLNALVRITPADLLTTDYGLLVLGKIAALAVLGVFGFLQRRYALRRVSAHGTAGSLLRLGALETLVMFATVGIAVALGRTPPPAEVVTLPSRVELLVGYDLHGPPTLARLLFDWRFDLVYGVAAIVLAGLYLLGVRRLRVRGDRWPAGRTAAWMLGCASLLLATSSGIGRYAPAMFSVHMGSHMMLNMLVPVLLVLGGPIALALRALPPAKREDPAGPREWLVAFTHSLPARVLTHPLVSLALFVGSFYLLYFAGLFDVALDQHWAHLAMNAHFLLTGYLYYWPLIGVDPAPRRLPSIGKLGLVFAAMPFHAFFGVILMMSQTVIGEDFYRGLALPWASDLLSDQRLGGGIAWAAGEIPLIIVMIALLVQWARADERAARRSDRRAEVDGEAELTAYNAMLRRMAGRDAEISETSEASQTHRNS